MSRRKAFTLIELLVVIAIIAILAAILFPVFAQAKDAAKDSVNLSNHKQAGLACLMYAGDYDDAFPLTANLNNTGTDLFWQDLTQPYIKNFDLLLHPKRPKPTPPMLISWTRSQYMGITPVPQQAGSTESAVKAAGYYTYNQATLTGGQTVRFDGIGGLGVIGDTGTGAWLDQKPAAASKTQTQIEGISLDIMVAESAEYDFWWGLGSGSNSYAFYNCVYWSPAGTYSSYGTQFGYAGPLAMKRPVDGTRSGINAGCFIPNGFTTYVATDGSAKAVNFRGEILKRQQRADGTYVFPRLWSSNTN